WVVMATEPTDAAVSVGAGVLVDVESMSVRFYEVKRIQLIPDWFDFGDRNDIERVLCHRVAVVARCREPVKAALECRVVLMGEGCIDAVHGDIDQGSRGRSFCSVE